MKRKNDRKSSAALEAAKTLLTLVPSGTRVLLPRRYRFVDPVPKPRPDFTNARYLEQVSLGRWIDSLPGESTREMKVAFQTLAKYLAATGERYLFPDGATREQQSRLIDALASSYARGFYLALLRYEDELKHVPEAQAMLEANRKNAKKGGAARRRQAEPRRQKARRLDRELRKEGGLMRKKTYRVERIAAELRVDTRTVQRYLSAKK